MQKKSLPMKVKHSCYRCGERENTRFSPESTFPYAVLGSLKVIDDYVLILLRIRIIQDASKSVTSQGAFYNSKGEYNEQGSHTHFAIRLGHNHVAAYPWSHQLCRQSGAWPGHRHLRQRHWASSLCANTDLRDRRCWMACRLCAAWGYWPALGDPLAAGWARASRNETNACAGNAGRAPQDALVRSASTLLLAHCNLLHSRSVRRVLGNCALSHLEPGLPGHRATPQAQRSPLPCRDYASLYSRSNHLYCLWGIC